MSAPLTATSRQASAPVLTEARPASFPRWAGVVVLSPLGARYLGLDDEGFDWFLRGTGVPFGVAGALTFLFALLSLGRWGSRVMLSQKHPYEPWLWDHSWRRELHDQRFTQLLVSWPVSLALLAILAVVHWLFYSRVFSQGQVLPGTLLGLVLLGFDVIIFARVLGPTVLGTLALLRFGRMCLRLPGVPLELGSRCRCTWRPSRASPACRT
ncbi:hypothetical protein ACN28S_52980 [Cystobacter fuscus]